MKFKKFMGGALAVTLALSAATGGMLSAVAETRQTNAPLANDAVTYAESADEMGGYLYVHFVGTEQKKTDEQVYFSVSSNAREWYVLNDGNPVAQSNLGDKGIRDPYILRKHDGSGYFIIATDLSIAGGTSWGASQSNGSHSIIVWETDDLRDLGEARMVEIAPKNATCTWAPEAIWDEEQNAYMVFWSALANKSTGMYWTHHVYRSYTTDFNTFTEPEIYIQSEQKTIDASIIKEGDTYYRFTKIETNTGDDIYNPNYGSKTIYMEKCKSLSGEWEMVSTYSLDGKHWSQVTGFEGPSIFKLNAKDTGGKDQWCLMIDDYGGIGYTPFLTDDITRGEFTKATDISFDCHGRHGSFLPLTKGEMDSLCAKYNLKLEETEREHKEIFSMSFEDNTDVNADSATATAYGSISYEDGVNGGKAARFGDNCYVQIESSALAGLDGFTVSFAAKLVGRTWAFYAAPSATAPAYNSENYLGLIWGENMSDPYLDAQRFKDGRNANASSHASKSFSVSSNTWKHITVVFGLKSTTVYVDGEEFAKTATATALESILGSNPTIYIGRANWGGGEYSNCVLDEYKIHNWGMTAAEVKANYNAVMGIAE